MHIYELCDINSNNAYIMAVEDREERKDLHVIWYWKAPKGYIAFRPFEALQYQIKNNVTCS